MNRIIRDENGKFTVDGNPAVIWEEKKGEKVNVHIRWKENGRYRYCGLNRFEKDNVNGVLEIEPTTPRTISGGGWKSRMTDDEKIEYEAAEAKMAEIKALCEARKPESTEEKQAREIAELKAELEALRKAKKSK